MTEQRHCPRCTMTFEVGNPPTNRAATICGVRNCGVAFWTRKRADNAIRMGVLPEHADMLTPGPFVPFYAEAAE